MLDTTSDLLVAAHPENTEPPGCFTGPDGEHALQASIIAELQSSTGGLAAWLRCHACSRDEGERIAAFNLLKAVLDLEGSNTTQLPQVCLWHPEYLYALDTKIYD